MSPCCWSQRPVTNSSSSSSSTFLFLSVISPCKYPKPQYKSEASHRKWPHFTQTSPRLQNFFLWDTYLEFWFHLYPVSLERPALGLILAWSKWLHCWLKSVAWRQLVLSVFSNFTSEGAWQRIPPNKVLPGPLPDRNNRFERMSNDNSENGSVVPIQTFTVNIV